MDAIDSKETWAMRFARAIGEWPRSRRRAAVLLAIAALVSSKLFFGDATANANTLVSINTNVGSFEVDLFDNVVPATVNNFLGYMATGAFVQTLIQQVETPSPGNSVGAVFGGGYRVDGDTGNFVHISTSAPIALDYHLANTRGTIAMARGITPNSATSDWLVNTVDNTTALGPSSGGGFTVFGQVIGLGMTTIDGIAALPVTTINQSGQTFTGFPLRNYDTGTNPPVTSDNLVLTDTVTMLGTHASFQNPIPSNFADVDNDGFVHPNDALAIINDLLDHGSHAAAAQFVGTNYNYVDVNGDGNVFPQDALIVIDALLNQSPLLVSATTTPLALEMPLGLVPEPSTFVLLAAGGLALGGDWSRRTRNNQGLSTRIVT